MFIIFRYFSSGIKKLLWQFQKKEMKAVYENDFHELLQSLGIYKQISSGEMKCEYCGTTITLDNIQALMPRKGRIVVICSHKNCLNKIQ